MRSTPKYSLTNTEKIRFLLLGWLPMKLILLCKSSPFSQNGQQANQVPFLAVFPKLVMLMLAVMNRSHRLFRKRFSQTLGSALSAALRFETCLSESELIKRENICLIGTLWKLQIGCEQTDGLHRISRTSQPGLALCVQLSYMANVRATGA